MKAPLCILVIFCAVVASSRIEVGIKVDRNVIDHSTEWVVDSRTLPNVVLPFTIAMKQSNIDKLTETLLDISNPNSENYGKYWTAKQVEELVRTTPEKVNKIKDWLEEYSVTQCRVQNGDLLKCEAPASIIEELFEIELYNLRSIKKEGVVSVTHFGRISIPARLKGEIDIIEGLSYIFYRKAKFVEREEHLNAVKNSFEHFITKTQNIKLADLSGPSNTSKPIRPVWNEELSATACPTGTNGCSTSNGVSTEFCCSEDSICCATLTGGQCCVGGYTCCEGQCLAALDCPAVPDIFVHPGVLRDFYSIPKGLRANNPLFNQSVVAFTDEFSAGALDYFWQVFNEKTVPVTRYGPPGCLPNCDQVESDLDMQYMSSMGSGIPQWFWYNAQGYTAEWAQEVLATPNAPIVHSISYISGEYQLGEEYIIRSNVEIEKMGVIGMTVMACAGDTGAPGWSINFPVDPLARNFPFSCPNCPLGVNLCNQINFKTANLSCNLPSGLYSRDIERDVPCKLLSVDQSCSSAYTTFQQQANARGCQFQIVKDADEIPRVFTMNCTCSQLPTVTSSDGKCTVSGYTFNLNNGSPLTSLYPASSPWVTAVGATQFSDQTNGLCGQQFNAGGRTIDCEVGEIVSSIATGSAITSGGGFSTISLAGGYQANAVQQYLQSGVLLPPSNLYNSSLRAYPDVSFSGHNWLISYSENTTESCPCGFFPVDGTSCSSPGFAGVVSSLNHQLQLHNRPVLGFFNPLLYQMGESFPQTFQDINVGDNYCTETLCSDKIGYRSAIGWDPVSGLGTPNFVNILDYLLNLD